MHSLGYFYYHNKKSNVRLSTFEREKTSAKFGQRGIRDGNATTSSCGLCHLKYEEFRKKN